MNIPPEQEDKADVSDVAEERPPGSAGAVSNIEAVRSVMLHEARAIERASQSLDDSIEATLALLIGCGGRIIFTGMGKMGCIARKASATFSSTGSPSVFLHPGEAVHGDLGAVTGDDVLVALSNSGETAEVLALLPYMHRFSVPVIAITGNPSSSLAARSTTAIDICSHEEAGPHSLAPTSSTTVALAVCDALAVCLMQQKGLTPEQFAIFHPGGSLGKKLLLTVRDLMHVDDEVPVVRSDQSLQDAIFEISQKRLGAALVLDANGAMSGILTDGDLRRAFQGSDNPLSQAVGDAMTTNPVRVLADDLAATALRLMEEKSITVLPVLETAESNRAAGIIHLHDLLRAGIA
ncbi:MAG: KpsF/GutQ family sugar-phosphate isomerase [Planctomycetota bacterium]